MIDNEHILNRSLPKWPQMLVSGESVSIEQSKEIIRTTDSYFAYPSGNSKSVIAWIAKELKYPYSEEKADFFIEQEIRLMWLNKWGYIIKNEYPEPEYVHNSWLSCAFINGPHG